MEFNIEDLSSINEIYLDRILKLKEQIKLINNDIYELKYQIMENKELINNKTKN